MPGKKKKGKKGLTECSARRNRGSIYVPSVSVCGQNGRGGGGKGVIGGPTNFPLSRKRYPDEHVSGKRGKKKKKREGKKKKKKGDYPLIFAVPDRRYISNG